MGILMVSTGFVPEPTVVEEPVGEEYPIIQIPCCNNCASQAPQNDGSHYCWRYELDASVDWYCMKHQPDAEFDEEETEAEAVSE
jgi:hypothetical protein